MSDHDPGTRHRGARRDPGHWRCGAQGWMTTGADLAARCGGQTYLCFGGAVYPQP
jgi:hypothetical protein